MKKVYNYDEDRIWNWLKTQYSIDVSDFESQEQLTSYIDELFKKQPVSGKEGRGGLGSYGEKGRELVKEKALDEYSKFYEEVREFERKIREREREIEKRRRKPKEIGKERERIEVEELETIRVKPELRVEEPKVELPKVEEPKIRVEEPKIAEPKDIGKEKGNFIKRIGKSVSNYMSRFVGLIKGLFKRRGK